VHCEEATDDLAALCDEPPAIGSPVCVAVRPEKIFISQQEPESAEDMRMSGIVEDLGYFGNLSLYRIRVASGKIVQVSAQNRRRSAERSLEWDDKVFISWHPRSSVLLVD
jgi:putrescine transport system ATP-binding protein